MITVFSASNYYEIGSNKGAYIKFGANSDRYFVQFTAAASKTKKLTFRQQVDNVEKSAIRELKEKLREQKLQLTKEFKDRDPDNTGANKKFIIGKIIDKTFSIYVGRISLSQWSEAMEAVTNFKLPWRLLREKLAVVNTSNEIVYANTLQMIESDDIVSANERARSELLIKFLEISFQLENWCQRKRQSGRHNVLQPREPGSDFPHDGSRLERSNID